MCPPPSVGFTGEDFTLLEFIESVREVETGGLPDEGEGARGDGGSARGPLQIWEACWIDAQVPFPYEKCDMFSYSVRVAVNYWLRYCPVALLRGDYETMARIWNGGPRGATGTRRQLTDSYWDKVRKQLETRRRK